MDAAIKSTVRRSHQLDDAYGAILDHVASAASWGHYDCEYVFDPDVYPMGVQMVCAIRDKLEKQARLSVFIVSAGENGGISKIKINWRTEHLTPN